MRSVLAIILFRPFRPSSLFVISLRYLSRDNKYSLNIGCASKKEVLNKHQNVIIRSLPGHSFLLFYWLKPWLPSTFPHFYFPIVLYDNRVCIVGFNERWREMSFWVHNVSKKIWFSFQISHYIRNYIRTIICITTRIYVGINFQSTSCTVVQLLFVTIRSS